MYIKSVSIQHIRSIKQFDMAFVDEAAGWHVLIGDNGAGKSSIVRSVALALIGPEEAIALRPSWEDWLSQGESKGSIEVHIKASNDWDKPSTRTRASEIPFTLRLDFKRDQYGSGQGHSKLFSSAFSSAFQRGGPKVNVTSNIDAKRRRPRDQNWAKNDGWFSAAYGPFRRFSGGNPEWGKLFYTYPKVGAHLSAFGEDVALTEALEWLRELDYKRLKENESESHSDAVGRVLQHLISFINQSGLLPHGATMKGIDSEGPVFVDGLGKQILVTQMSDGYRSILSLTFELIRQLVRVYGPEPVFKDIAMEQFIIDLPGVVLIDEVDAHLHPTWQTRIGQWFTKCFPKLQFIVTSHSPLICRAAANGTIWRLAAPGSSLQSGEVTGVERDRLIYGNVLDAYGTEIFGKNVSRSKESADKMQEMASLNLKSLFGEIDSQEDSKLQELRQILPTSGK